MKIGNDARQAIEQAMAGLSGTRARDMASSLASSLGVSVQRIYTLSRHVRPARRRRSDCGTMRAMSEETFSRLAAYTVQADMTGHRLMHIARANDLDAVAPATYNRYLRRRGISRRQIVRPVITYRPWEASASNILHQVDSTQAETFYLNPDGSVGYEPECRRYKNKRGNRRPRLHLVSIVDDYSRVTWATFCAGNAAPQWLWALHGAWSQKDDPYFPFWGLPEAIYVDNDAVIKSSMFRRAMKMLDVSIRCTGVDHPQSKGKVERSMRWLNDYQKILRFRTFESVDALNADLYDYLIGKNNRIHSITRQAPFQRWVAGIDTARRPPAAEHLERLTLDTRRAKVYPDLTVQVLGRRWQLPRHVDLVELATREEKIEVCWYRDDPDHLVVSTGSKEWMLDPGQSRPQPDAAGTYKSMPVAPIAKLRKDLSTRSLKDDPLVVSGFYRKQAGRTYLSRPDQAAAPSMTPIPERVLSRTVLVQRLQRDALLPRLLDRERDADILCYLDERYAAGDVYESDMPGIIDAIRDMRPIKQRSA